MPLKSSHVAKVTSIPTYRNSLSSSKVEGGTLLEVLFKRKKKKCSEKYLYLNNPVEMFVVNGKKNTTYTVTYTEKKSKSLGRRMSVHWLEHR